MMISSEGYYEDVSSQVKPADFRHKPYNFLRIRNR